MTDGVAAPDLEPQSTQTENKEPGMPGFVPNILACIFAVLAIIMLALVFFPIAVICAIVAIIMIIRSDRSRKIGALAMNGIAWVLIAIAFATSPTLWAILFGAALSTSSRSYDPSPPRNVQKVEEVKKVEPKPLTPPVAAENTAVKPEAAQKSEPELKKEPEPAPAKPAPKPQISSQTKAISTMLANARTSLDAKRYQDAITTCRNVLTLDPSNTTAKSILKTAQERQKRAMQNIDIR